MCHMSKGEDVTIDPQNNNPDLIIVIDPFVKTHLVRPKRANFGNTHDHIHL